MSKERKKLVPLMPILRRLGACNDAKRWLGRKRFRTFTEAWTHCDHAGWMLWLVAKALDCERGVANDNCIASNASHKEVGAAFGAYDLYDPVGAYRVRRTFDARRVERALYDFAVREGIAR
jgi:hypothetical protein